MTDDEIQERLADNCVYLSSPDRSIGTGYVIARGYAATANHVVKAWVDNAWYEVHVGMGRLRVVGQARIVARDVDNDAALLELTGADHVQPLPLSDVPSHGEVWHGYGFPKAVQVGAARTGLPMSGKVVHAKWFNGESRHRLLLSCNEASAGVGTPLHGYSGTPVTVNGALVGHVLEQFGDPDDRNRPAYGMVKACPIEVVRRLMPAAAMPGVSWPRKRQAAIANDTDLADLLSWCDRGNVVAAIEAWLEPPDALNAGVLLLTGHGENRTRLVIERVAEELSERAFRPIRTRAVHINKDQEVGVEAGFRKIALGALGVGGDADVKYAQEYQNGAELILLSYGYGCDRWTGQQMQQRMRETCEWTDQLRLERIKLLAVIEMRHETPGLFDRLLRRDTMHRIKEAFAAHRQTMSALASKSLIADLVHLGNYSLSHLRTWRNLDRVKWLLPSTELEQQIAAKWPEHETRSYTELSLLVNEAVKKYHLWRKA